MKPSTPKYLLFALSTVWLSSAALGQEAPSTDATAPGVSAPQAVAASDAIPSALPQVMEQNGVTFVTGGIGEDERQALEAAAPSYNLHLLIADTTGAFVSGTHVTVSNKEGANLLVSDAGPYFYAKLPNGKYTIEAQHGEENKKQSFTIHGAKPVKLHYAWKPEP